MTRPTPTFRSEVVSAIVLRLAVPGPPASQPMTRLPTSRMSMPTKPRVDLHEHLELGGQDQPRRTQVQDLAGEFERAEQSLRKLRAPVSRQEPEQQRQQLRDQQGAHHSERIDARRLATRYQRQ